MIARVLRMTVAFSKVYVNSREGSSVGALSAGKSVQLAGVIFGNQYFGYSEG